MNIATYVIINWHHFTLATVMKLPNRQIKITAKYSGYTVYAQCQPHVGIQTDSYYIA